MQSLQKLAKDNMVNGYDYDKSKDIDFCESCTEGKHHRIKFLVKESGHAKEPLGTVHSDVCGNIGTQSLGGAEYFLTFIDDHTHYTWVYASAENSTGKKDNGGEYISAEFENVLKKGVKHQLTMPKTPEQNGAAERMNRTLVESLRSMLADAKLPRKFWAETLSTAVYLRNRSPTTAVEGKTPFEAWTGQKPNVKHLGAFGCDAYDVPKMKGRNSILKPESVFFWVMALVRKDIVYMIQNVVGSSKVEMSSSTKPRYHMAVKCLIISH